MRIGFQILQCPVRYTVWNALHHMIVLPIKNEYSESFQFTRCAISATEMVGSGLSSYILSQNILFFFCERTKTGLTFLDEQIALNRFNNKDTKFYQKPGYGKEEDKPRDRAIVIVKCCWNDRLYEICGREKNNETGNGKSCQMTWSQFKEAKDFIYKGCRRHCLYSMKLTWN